MNLPLLAHVKASKSPKPGAEIVLENAAILQCAARAGELFELNSAASPIMDILEQAGHIPLPPYIEREDQAADIERYQTVYAKQPGAVAAPTAGLHFDENMLAAIAAKGVLSDFVTLHVGAGTFQPMRADDINDHVMHKEYLTVSQAVCEKIQNVRASGKRVIAVGTTSVRALETAAQSGELKAYQGETDIFIYPGYQFKAIDGLLTNFHLPESTLIMLVSALAGYENTMAAYRNAVSARLSLF